MTDLAKPVKQNPNTAVAGGTSGAGILAVWLLGYFGVDLTPELGALIAGGAATVALAIGRDGIRGLCVRLWRGRGG